MANRNLRFQLRRRSVNGGSLPSNTLFGEPFINDFNGVLKLSGVTGGDYEESEDSGIFEVGSKLYNSKVTNRISVNDNFIVSGDTGVLSTYAGISGPGLTGKFMSGTTSGFILADISEIQGVSDITRVEGGTNISTGGTDNNPIINLDDDIFVNDITVSGNGEFAAITSGGTPLESIIENIALENGDITRVEGGTNISTGGTDNNPIINLDDNIFVSDITVSGTGEFATITSGGTNLYDIFLTEVADSDITRVEGGTNISTGGTDNNPVINLDDNIFVNDITVSGSGEFNAITSGGTPLEDIIENIALENGDITRVEGGTNISTGGTDNNPVINLDDDIFVNDITVSGSGEFNAITSGGTPLEDIIENIALENGDITRVEGGTNISTGGTDNNPVINLDDDIFVNDITVSGTGEFNAITSGGTDLYDIFLTEAADSDITRVEGGTNISTGGTDNNPIINLDDDIFVNDITVSGTGEFAAITSGGTPLEDLFLINDGSLSPGLVPYVDLDGNLTTEVGFSYDEGKNVLNTPSIVIGDPSTTGETTTTVYGNILLIGESISGFTSELYIEDNRIELNFNPTADTSSTSLGSGWLIQDGSGVSGQDVFLDVRGSATGILNRSLSTNLEDFRIRETGTFGSPNGKRVIAEDDILNGGSY